MRMIDAELLTTNIAQIAKNCARSDAQKALIGRILFMIENMPTADVQLAKHGRWIENSDPGQNINEHYMCSECGCTFHNWANDNYCPNCGCKQDLGGDGDD
jgi:rubrerythrin